MTPTRCDGGTKFSMLCALLDLRSCSKEGFQENPVPAFNGNSNESENSFRSRKENMVKQTSEKNL